MTLNQVRKGDFDLNFPLYKDVKYMHCDLFKAYLNRTWEPTLTVIGQDGLPHLSNAGNVLRPYTSLCLSLRIPPILDAQNAKEFLRRFFEDQTWLNNSKISIESMVGMSGYNAKPLNPKLSTVLNQHCLNIFGEEPLQMGEGGSIPLINTL